MRGNVRQRAKGTWTLTIELPPDPATGKRRQAYETFRGPKRDALRRLSELQAKVDQGQNVKPSRATVGQFLEEWLTIDVDATKRATTARGYRWYVSKYIAPVIGSIPLKDLRPEQVQAIYAGMLTRGLSAQTCLNAHRIVRRALAQAMKWGRVTQNVADAATPPRPEAVEARGLVPDEVELLLAEAHGSEYYPIIYTALWTGARRSEILALRWRDVDLMLGTISITRRLDKPPREAITFDEPKSRKGKRAISMPPSLSIVLREHREKWEKLSTFLGTQLKLDDLIFRWPDGRPMLPSAVTHGFKRIARRAGLGEFHLHELRHTHASLMLAQGANPKVVQERLGHANIGITLDTYSHVTDGIQAAAALKFDQSLAMAVPELRQEQADAVATA